MKKNCAKHLVKSKKMPIHSLSDKRHLQTEQKVLAKVENEYSKQDLCTAGPPLPMEKAVWSSPQIGGTGGALKALAKNVANHLEQLNRATLKHVVAQVIAERHSLGEVSDFNGHMYFARPDHINFAELIAQSKEAFDDLVKHKSNTERPQKPNPKTKMLQQHRPTGGQATAAAVSAKRTISSKKQPPRTMGSSRLKRCESPTTIFQLDDEGGRSLNGVIIDDSYLPLDRKDILLQVSKRPPKKHRAPKGILVAQPHAQPQAKPQSPPKVKAKSKTPPKWRNSLQRINSHSETTAAPAKVSLKCQLPVGASHHPPSVSAARGRNQQKVESVAPPKQPSKKVKAMSKVGSKIPLLQRRYAKPWLVQHSPTKRADRMAGGLVVEKKTPLETKGEMAIHGQSKIDSHVAKQIKSVVFPWYTPFQFQGGAGATASQPTAKGPSRGASKVSPNRKPPSVRSRSSLQKSPQSKARVHFNVGPKNKQKPPAVIVPATPKAKSLNTRQVRNNRLQARLTRDLKREEAIDEPERLKSGGQRGRRAKQQQNPGQATSRKARPSSKSSPHIRRRRSRLVSVDSSLGSFACLRPSPTSKQNSKTTLTPAKRHLTIAFFNKRQKERGQRQASRQPWK
ncbi:serine/arginine repetitive matrix protein 2 [Drosophila madeirensis]|uniref:Serine/arginine repetitive matrix protein 2 n=1 Tax=Drosophila madeirensis TaxID=30013 RepID=A0AAU9G4P8_DROMD